MDKVKAIKVLKPLVDSYVDYANISMKEEDDNIVEALEMAIEALKALDVPDTNVGDMISRQAAIDALDEQIEQCNKALGSFDISPKDEYAIKVERASLKAYRELLENLPSVQPDHVADVSKKVSISCSQENDLISRQATIDLVGDWIYNPEDLRYHKDVINSIPAAQPEIVRCKDCKHWDTEWSVSESGAHYCPVIDGNRNSDFYCADAERRTDDKTNKGSSC